MITMTISGGPSQLPAVILPHEVESKFEFEKSGRFDLSSKALTAVAALGGGIIAGAILLMSSHLVLGSLVIGACIVLFLWSRR